MERYDFKSVEAKWQKRWLDSGIYRAVDGAAKKKFYALIEFPYPSGDGLHVGHVRSYTALDTLARKRRMEGWNVLYPIGWDAFGLPTENYAVKTGVHPQEVTKQNTDTFRRQLQSLGFSFDWDREVNTTDPAYYRWTQWIFIQLFKRGLAYKAKTTINWCPSCKIGLANEEVVAGKCERCGTGVEERLKEQWMLRITAYAEKLLAGLDTVDFLSRIKDQQVHWIGKSEGAHLTFPLVGVPEQPDAKHALEVFTTRPDTLFGVTFMVVSPELARSWVEKGWQASEAVRIYIDDAIARRKVGGELVEKEKTGVDSGIRAVNPATKEEIPVWVSDYVLPGYGTGAIMAVPAHDERDFEFAKKFGLKIKGVIFDKFHPVVVGKSDNQLNLRRLEDFPKPYSKDLIKALESQLQVAVKNKPSISDGVCVGSGEFDGMDSESAKWAITESVGGTRETQYHLRDWIFSRQRYWGEPIPMVHCDACALRDPSGQGWVPVPEDQLPVTLPDLKDFTPRDDGESPLASVKEWVTTSSCPSCGGPARRETDVMPNWAGSSWYFLRYADPKNDRALADPEKLRYWMPVDWYNGGMEHTTLHLLYSRFWNLFLHDIGAVPVAEPYAKRTSHGMILGAGGVKMSKSRGNVVNPDEVVARYGADALRLYELFIGPFDQAIPWDDRGIEGTRRFIDRVWQIQVSGKVSDVGNSTLERVAHRTLKKVGDDIETMGYNTAVSSMMVFLNACEEASVVSRTAWELFMKILAPFAPHLAEELWHKLGHEDSVHAETWPQYDPTLLVDETATVVVQVKGKPRATVIAPRGADQAAVEALARAEANVARYLAEGKVRKTVFVQDRLINFVL